MAVLNAISCRSILSRELAGVPEAALDNPGPHIFGAFGSAALGFFARAGSIAATL
jgi:hypothetical protein